MAKQKTTQEKVTPAPQPKSDLVKVVMLRDMVIGLTNYPCESIQELPSKVVGLWEHESRKYCKRIK